MSSEGMKTSSSDLAKKTLTSLGMERVLRGETSPTQDGWANSQQEPTREEPPDPAPQEEGPDTAAPPTVEADRVPGTAPAATTPLPPGPARASDRGSDVSEPQSSIEAILDKPLLGRRIREALAQVDRAGRLELCEQLGSSIAEYNAVVTELVEANVVKEDAIHKTLFLPLTEAERKEYREDLVTVKRDDLYLALTRIHDHRTYREDHRSWDEFLHQQLGIQNPHDWWERKKRRVRIKELMDEQGIRNISLNDKMSGHLNKVHDEPELFVSCLAEFQRLPENSRTAKRLGEIVKRQRDAKTMLASLRQSVPDATPEELGTLAPVRAADQRRRNWYPQVQQQLLERVKSSGQPPQECLLKLAEEIRSLPDETALLGVARGPALVPLVDEVMRLYEKWVHDQEEKEEREDWLRQGERLGLYDPDSGTVRVPGRAGGDGDGREGQDKQPSTPEPTPPKPVIYDPPGEVIPDGITLEQNGTGEGQKKAYRFDVSLVGSGDTPEEAWEDVVENAPVYLAGIEMPEFREVTES
jgi:hypothetical protein